MPGGSDLALSTLRGLTSLFPEGRLKNRLRALVLRYRSALPRELMIGSGQTVVQVGMWRRRNLWRLSKCVGPEGRVILIEADRSAAEDLRTFIADHQLDNVTLVNKAAFSRKGRELFLQGTSPTFSRLGAADTRMPSEDGHPFVGEEEREVDTVDNIVADQGVERVDYLEITVNGLELEVLGGMDQTLRRTDRLFLAGCAVARESGEPTNRRTAAYLCERGFRTRIAKSHVADQRLHPGQEVRAWGLLEGHVFAWRD